MQDHTGVINYRPTGAFNCCSILIDLLPLFLLLFIYIRIHRCTKYVSTMQLAPLHFLLFLCILHYLDRERVVCLLLTQINTFFSSATFLLILTFWYPVKCSLKTPNYASLFFFLLFKFFLPNDLAHNCFQLCEIGSDIYFCVRVSVYVCV